MKALARLPYEPVARYIGNTRIAYHAQVLDLNVRTLHRWRDRGIPTCRAEAVAGELDLEPEDLWGTEWKRPAA